MKKILYLLLLICSSAFSQEGIVKTFYASGSLQSEISYHKNIRDGLSKFYYENGSIKEERNYVNGRVEGVVKKYYENGKPSELFTLVNNKKDGSVIYYKNDGTIDYEEYYSEGLKVKEEILPDDEIVDSTLLALDEDGPQLPPNVKEKEEIDTTAFYTNLEIMPEIINGMNSINKRLHYPKSAKDKKIQGVVNVEVYIDEKGNVVKTLLLNSLDPACEEAAQIVVSFTRFKPGQIRGIPVKSKLVIPVEFKL